MSNMKFKGLLAGASLAATVAFAGGAASAATINISSSEGALGLNGSIAINLAGDQSSVSTGQYLFDVTLTNSADAYDNSSITAFSLISNPASTYEDDSSSNFSFGEADYAFNPNNSTFDFCLETDTNDNCQQGSTSNGVSAGNSETFTLTVSADSTPTFFGGALRWQGVGNGNDTGLSGYGECTSDCGNGGVTPPGVIPLPAGLPLILTGLGVFGALRLRKRKTA